MIAAILVPSARAQHEAEPRDAAAMCDWGYGPKDGPDTWAELCGPICAGPR